MPSAPTLPAPLTLPVMLNDSDSFTYTEPL